jgi:hypothetical protein
MECVMRVPRLLVSIGLFTGMFALAVIINPGLSPNVQAQVAKAAAVPVTEKQEAVKKGDKSEKKLNPIEQDQKSLETAGIKHDDAAALVAYLKSRTLNDADLGKIQTLIKQMGEELRFDDRLSAQEKLIQIGGQAVSPLRISIRDSQNAELVFRAKECIQRMEKEKSLGADVTTAVIRALGRSKDARTVPTVLSFLPLADSATVADTIQVVLRDSAADAEGKANKLLVDALADPNANCRRVVALALIEGGTTEKRIRFPELQPKFVEMAKTDKDPAVRFVLARSLLVESRDKNGIEVLIDLIPDLTRGQSWQVEELLVQIAGKDAPTERCKHIRDARSPDKELSSNKASREKTRDAWKKWWTTAKDKIDLTKTEPKPTLRGYFMLVNQSWNGIAQTTMTEFGADDKERERIAFPMNNSVQDIVLTDNRLLILEHGNPVVNVRDLAGKATTSWPIPVEKNAIRNGGFQPKGLQVRENGNLFVVHASGVAELDPDGKEVFKYTRPEVNKTPQMDIAAATRMKNGELVLCLTNSKMIVLDEKGKEVEGRKSIQIGQPMHKSLLQQTGDDTVLLVEQDKIIEYDLKQGKAAGIKIPNVFNSMVGQKLPNGNILFTDQNTYPPRIVEKTAKGDEVWSYNQLDQQQNLLKAMVR